MRPTVVVEEGSAQQDTVFRELTLERGWSILQTGHECQRVAPACWPATLLPRWGAPGDDLAQANRPEQARDSPRWSREAHRRTAMTVTAERTTSVLPRSKDRFRADRTGVLLAVVGASTRVPLIDGTTRTYANLDNAASAPALERVAARVSDVLPLYASV